MMKLDVGNVGAQHLVGSWLHKLSTENVRCDTMFLCFLHDIFVRISPSDLGYESIFLHDSLDLLVIHENAFCFKVHTNGSPTIFSFPFEKDGFNEEEVFIVTIRDIFGGTPLVISTA